MMIVSPPPASAPGPLPARTPGGVEGLLDAKILLVDDNPVGRLVLEASLNGAGFTNLRSAADGEQALALTAQWGPELIITDLMMPKMDGFDFCRRLGADPGHREVPIIVQTARGEPGIRGDIFDAGASDLVLKPINPRELVSRVRIHLERRRLITSLIDYKQRIADELDTAKAMQLSLLPTPAQVAALCRQLPIELAGHCQPSFGLGGDIWGLDALPDDRLRLWSADFAGHGVQSAVNTFRLHTFLATGGAPAARPGDWLGEVNEFLCGVLPVGQFATMLCAVVDFKRERLTLASAAAPPPILSDGEHYEALNIAGLPLGVARNAEYETLFLPFARGATLFAYSDALTETPNPEEPVLPLAALVSHLQACRNETLGEIQAGLIARLTAAMPGGLADDLTLIALHHVGGAP